MNKKLELLEQSAKLLAAARAIAESDASADGQAKADALLAESLAAKEQADRLDRIAAAESAVNKSGGFDPRNAVDSMEKMVLDLAGRDGKTNPLTKEEMERSALAAYFTGGMDALRGAPDLAASLQLTDLTRGGYVRPPTQFITELLKAADDLLFIRRLGRVISCDEGQSLGAVSLDTDLGDYEFTVEIPATAIAADDALRLGGRELKPYPFTKEVKFSKTIAAAPTTLDIVSLVQERMAYKKALTEEKAFMTGSGSNQPLGLFTVHAQGLTTARDVASGNSATSLAWDGILSALGTLKDQYLASPSCAFLFHRDGVTQLMKLKDAESRYIWEPSMVAGAPNTIRNIPVYRSEWVPNTFTSGLYVGMLADFSKYWIADAGIVNFQRLVELYARTNEDAILTRYAVDGAPVLPEAFVRITLG